jgi:hypothetical protein
MNDLPRHTLSRIIAEHGREICAAPKRVEALLRDLCGAHRREINIISGALEERVAADLIAAGNSVPRDVLLARLAARLRDNLAYTPEAARWGVETWAVALGILSEAELQARARTESSETSETSGSKTPPPVQAPKPPAANPASASPQASPHTTQLRRGQTYAPPQQPAPSPKTNPTSPIIRTPAPVTVPRRTPTIQPNVFVPQTPQPDVSQSLPAQQTRRRGLTLRGCFIIIMLIIALIATAAFVIPGVLFLLQEEQAQPSINEPRIR